MNNEEIKVNNKIIYTILLSGLIVFVICSLLIKNSFSMKKLSADDISKNNSDISFCIDSQEYNESINTLSINGWVLKNGQSISRYNSNVVLKDIENDEYISIPTKLVSRKDVTEAFSKDNNTLNYDNSGFQAKVDITKLTKPLNDYEICIQYNNNDENSFVNTGILLTKGGIEKNE